MPPPLPLSALRAFDAITRTGSFRAAAKDMSLTSSAVSHAIRGFEVALGTTLFLREGRSIRLTEEGEMLARYTEHGFGALQLGISNVSSRGQPQLLRLHSAPSFAAQWLLPRLRRLFSEVRGLEVRIAAGTDYTRFTSDEFDADIVYGVRPPVQWHSQHLTLFVCGPPSCGRATSKTFGVAPWWKQTSTSYRPAAAHAF
jgi:LysR family transcriptional regulator, glycine cleavage system transcriptional activator